MVVQALFERYNLRQRDLTKALKHFQPPISRTTAHDIWHGIKPLSVRAALAIHREFPKISKAELFDALAASRQEDDDTDSNPPA